PEFIGQLPITVALDELTKVDLKRIISEPKNAILKQYQESFKLDNADLEFTDDAIDAIVQKAIDQKTGARGLRAIVEKILIDVMFEIPHSEEKKRIIVNADTVMENKAPLVETVKKSA
ncbi:MAG TPA: ATP-dependent Clp protease ATP-binding subunit ClpX, partial [Spirochaetales bacterium]|nr:ATP-dependent Clp protease ATP-binding subunit ClpX [Spirochaetales bacterium]